jgi:hypothetical protein
VEDSAFRAKVGCFQTHRFTDAKASSGEQCEENSVAVFDACEDFLGRVGRPVKTTHQSARELLGGLFFVEVDADGFGSVGIDGAVAAFDVANDAVLVDDDVGA